MVAEAGDRAQAKRPGRAGARRRGPLDGITRLGRAYNLAAPAGGRIPVGGVDSAALHPPKISSAPWITWSSGSLTILATALIDSGSKMDEAIFEEFKGTGEPGVRCAATSPDRRLFPAVDAVQSGTRREASDEQEGCDRLEAAPRAVLPGPPSRPGGPPRAAAVATNIEFLMQVQRTTPTAERRARVTDRSTPGEE